MFTFSDTFVPATQYVAELEHATWVAALDETEHDYTPDPADYAYGIKDDSWSMLDLTPPPWSDEDEHMLVNHYRGI